MAIKKKIVKKRLPEKPKVTVKDPTPENSNRLIGWVLLAVGLFLLVRHTFGFDILKFWPVLMVALGAYIIWYRK